MRGHIFNWELLLKFKKVGVIKSVKKQLIIFFLFVFNLLSYSKIYKSEVVNISTNESLIIGKTSRLNFNMVMQVEGENITQDDFCSFFKEQGNDFIKISNLEIKNNKYKKRGNNIYFSEINDRLSEKLELPITGTFIFNWNKNTRSVVNRIEEINIGYVNSEQNPILLSINLSDLDPIANIKVAVIDDMDLGTVFSGEKLSTKNVNSNGTPAKIRIEGENNKKIKISIPESMSIVNSKNDTLAVKLGFRENNSNVLEKTLNSNTGKIKDDQTIILDDVLIDGECQSNKNSNGTYEGSFIVRVEYCLDS